MEVILNYIVGILNIILYDSGSCLNPTESVAFFQSGKLAISSYLPTVGCVSNVSSVFKTLAVLFGSVPCMQHTVARLGLSTGSDCSSVFKDFGILFSIP